MSYREKLEMCYRKKLEMCRASGQMTAAEVQAHITAGELSETTPKTAIPAVVKAASLEVDKINAHLDATIADCAIDKAIYDIDAIMNGVQPGDEVPLFVAERMVEMRAILRKLIASGRQA